jgi:hypothetical protein
MDLDLLTADAGARDAVCDRLAGCGAGIVLDGCKLPRLRDPDAFVAGRQEQEEEAIELLRSRLSPRLTLDAPVAERHAALLSADHRGLLQRFVR